MNTIRAELKINGLPLSSEKCFSSEEQKPSVVSLPIEFDESVRLDLQIEIDTKGTVRIEPRLKNRGDNPLTLEEFTLLMSPVQIVRAPFGSNPDKVSVLTQAAYGGGVVPLVSESTERDEAEETEPAGNQKAEMHRSELFSVVYDRESCQSFLAGFDTSERWLGRVSPEIPRSGETFEWRLGFDGGDTIIAPAADVELERIVLLAGSEPWALMETYGDIVKQRHNPSIPEHPPVSWCSWYPFRLGVSEERVLDNARIAAQRLKPLGLSIMEVDLGWQRDNLPCAFEENERFSHGLKWLAERLKELGFDLGAWASPFTISEFDPIAVEHPERLICDEKQKPISVWTWFWEPHGDIFILDLTVPESQDWLREKMAGLRDRGVKYLKMDFIGFASHGEAKRRQDRTIVCGAGAEAARIGARIIREENPEALILNCGGPEMPGTGQWPLLYSCSDTGNGGFLSCGFQRDNYESLACHLFKNKRWGILQPSCLVVGLPGTIEESQWRATIAFMTGGQVDISDDLTTLPEARWRILTATLPVSTMTARPIDLFEPIRGPENYDYSGVCRNEDEEDSSVIEHPRGSVWTARVETDWDEWNLVSVFSFQSLDSSATPSISRYWIPLARLGMEENKDLWAYEFWSTQFLGGLTDDRSNPGGYVHPGDCQALLFGDRPDLLDIGFFGPGVKLLCLRKARDHPWVIGTTFHQSCGTELKDVSWDESTSTLSGTLERPVGETGSIIVFKGGREPSSCFVDGRSATWQLGANDSLVIPLVVAEPTIEWRIVFS